MNAHTFPIRIPDPFEEAERLREEALQEQYREWQRNGIRGLHEYQNNPREDVSFDEWCERWAA